MLNVRAAAKRTVPVSRRASGYTLIEVGLVVLLLGFVTVMVADFYVNQLRMDRDMRRVAGTVRDMQALIDASVLWAEAFGRWPNDADVIDLDALIAAGFLTEVARPRNRYPACADCEDYALAGWDRDVIGPDGQGDYTPLASAAEDLVVRVETNRRTDADLIAGQLPLGHITETSPGVYEIEARVLGGRTYTDEYVRVRNEDRPVAFAVDSLSHNVQGGDLQRVGRITAGKQLPPCGSGQNPFADNCQSETAAYVTQGPAIVFHERPCEVSNEDGEDETQDPDRYGCRVECVGPKREGDTCRVAPRSDQPTILLREGLAEAPMCDYMSDPNCERFELGVVVNQGRLDERRVAGPAVVLHGTDEAARDRPHGPVVHLLSKGAGGYAKVRISGGLEVARERGRDGAVQPGQPDADSGDYMYTLPSGQDVITQGDLDWVQCCMDELVYDDIFQTVDCSITVVRQCVEGRRARRAASP